MGLVYRLSLAFLRLFLLPYWPTCVYGLTNLPPRGGAVLACNHPTILDGLILGTVSPRPLRFLVYAQAMRVPLVGSWLAALGFIPVEPGSEPLARAVACLQQDDCVGIFPEAVPTHSYSLRPFRRGVAALALASAAPVVPVAVLGTEALCPVDARYVRGGPVCLRFGPPLSARPDESVDELRDRIQAAVALLLEAPATPVRKPSGPGFFVCRMLWMSVSCPLLWLADAMGFGGRR